MSTYAKSKKQSHPVRSLILAVLVVLAVIVLILILRYQSKIKLYKDPATTGNTSTNLLNGGLFTQADGRIYFANPYDKNSLYSMDENLTQVKKIYNDYVGYINAAGDYIFYTRRNDKKGNDNKAFLSLSTTGLYRLRTNGSKLGQLYRDPTQAVNLLGNHIYYQHYDHQKGLQLFRVGIDGKEDTLLLDEGASPTTIVNDTIYYTGIDSDHSIHSMSTDGYNSQLLCEGNFTGLSYSNGALYCMDMDNDYTLCRLELDGSNLTHLTQERIATYNISEDGETIYYQLDSGTDNGLYALDVNSGSHTLLRLGNFNYFHIISDYLFFENYDGSEAYVMNTSTEEIQDFHPEPQK